MAVWETAEPAVAFLAGLDGGDRVNIGGAETVWVRILSPKFRYDDGTEHGFIGHGMQIVVSNDYVFEEE